MLAFIDLFFLVFGITLSITSIMIGRRTKKESDKAMVRYYKAIQESLNE